ncbi:MAG: sugar phosphate isomerase/epimerase family protein [Planctomycetia bacterium]|nr:sugar phosphate isomerase/epimerase family protein [Planctomycetia bacterium]
MNRRDFLGSSAILGFGLANVSSWSNAKAQTTSEMDKREIAKLRISSQMGVAPGDSEEKKLANMKKFGCEAVEYHGGVVGQGAKYKKMADDAGLEVSVICWGSHGGDLCKGDPKKIDNLKVDLKKALETAGELKARGVIYVPAFAHETKMTNQEIRQLCLDFLPEMGEFAKQCNTHVILEPLCRMEAFFLRQVADGASICRDCGGVDSGVSVMGDFYHMYTEETSDMGAFISAGDYLQHVHLAGGTQQPSRTLPGQNPRTFVDGFRGLKYIGYNGFCSFECGCQGDRIVEFPKSIQFLYDQWEQA